MRRLVASVAVVAALVAGIVVLMDATQNRPDEQVDGTSTSVDFTVATRGYRRGEPAAALALWTVCSASVGGAVDPVPQRAGDRWRVTITPAIGEHGENRLVGCLEDATLDRVVGDVVALRSGR